MVIDPLATIRIAATLLVPPRCAICCAPAPGASLLCAACERALKRSGGGSEDGRAALRALSTVSWAASYRSTARELVIALKFSGRRALATGAAAAIECRLELERLPRRSAAAIVPVPAAPLRLRRRGFDPGELIALELARRSGRELRPCLGRRSDRRQVGRGRTDRLSRPPRVRVSTAPPAAALLVDDVLTTGATLGACATALRAAGCESVEAAVFARSLGQRASAP